jgi:hypothetical protein
MKHALKKLITVFCLGISLSTTTPPKLVANTKDNIELVTALLRGYAAYSEYELRNDTSQSAHVKRALIGAVRLINDACAYKIIQYSNGRIQHIISPVLSAYDSIQTVKNLYACLKANQPNTEQTNPAAIKDDHEHETLRRFVLPAIEMLGALARTEMLFSRSPLSYLGYNALADISIEISRYMQCFCAAPKNSARRKIWGTLMVLSIFGLIGEITRLGTVAEAKQEQFNRAQNAFLAMVKENRVSAAIIRDPQDPQDNQCSVCYDHGKSHALNCGHGFCYGCLEKWIVGQAKQGCPLCRAEIQSIYKVPEPAAY